MGIATLTSKGQITLPKDIRDLLGLEAGDQINFVVEDGAVRVRPMNASIMALKGFLHKPGRKPASLADMDKAILAGVMGRM